MSEIDISIIIVNFNSFSYLSESLRSLFESDFPQTNIEIIVIDNASTDNSVINFKRNFPKIRLIENKINIGFAKANNQGIHKSQGKYILLLNPDTLIPKETIRTLYNFMRENIKVGIVTCKVEMPDGKLDDACHRGFPTPWNAFCQFSGISNIFKNSLFLNGYHLGYINMEKVHEIDSCTGAFMFVRKRAGEDVNWFDEEYFWYGEDLDFCYRIKKNKWKIVYFPNVKIVHYKGVSGGIKRHSKKISTADRQTRINSTKARYSVMRIFYKKHYINIYPFWIRFLILSGIKIKEIFSLLYERII